jgi:hypothetical protein
MLGSVNYMFVNLYYMRSSFDIYESKTFMWFYAFFSLAACTFVTDHFLLYLFTCFYIFFTRKLNIWCILYDVIMSICIMNDRQREAVARKGFQSILQMSTDSLVVGSLMNWLMDKLDPVDITIRPAQERS